MNSFGIWLYGSSQNVISRNTVYRNDYGIRVESSSNNNFERNIVNGNWGGIGDTPYRIMTEVFSTRLLEA